MDLVQAPQKIAGPPPERHLGMNRTHAQCSFLGLASPDFPFASRSLHAFSCDLHPCRHWTLLLSAPLPLSRAASNIQYTVVLAGTGDYVRLYPRCAQMQSAKRNRKSQGAAGSS